MTAGAVVAAGGRGERLGADVAKALVPVGGEPLVVHACRALLEGGVSAVVVAAPKEDVSVIAALLPDVDVVEGGATRVASVRRGLQELRGDIDVVLVHDAARGLMPVGVIRAVIEAVAAGADAVVPVLPVADTVKEVDSQGHVVRTIDRAGLRAVQTPQGFRRTVLEAAHADATDDAATDDAALVERVGVPVTTVAGSPYGLKVTTPFDLAVAEALLHERVGR